MGVTRARKIDRARHAARSSLEHRRPAPAPYKASRANRLARRSIRHRKGRAPLTLSIPSGVRSKAPRGGGGGALLGVCESIEDRSEARLCAGRVVVSWTCRGHAVDAFGRVVGGRNRR